MIATEDKYLEFKETILYQIRSKLEQLRKERQVCLSDFPDVADELLLQSKSLIWASDMIADTAEQYDIYFP